MQRSAMVLCLAGILGMALSISSATAGILDVKPEYTIPLDESDRVLGSLRGNFLVYGRPTITMYNTRGKPVFSRKLKNNVKPSVSPEGKFLALVTYADHSPTDLKTVKLELFDQAGRFKWKLSDPPPNTYYVTDFGSIIGIEGVKGIPPTRIYVYNRNGTLYNILPFDEFHGIEIAPSGERFIVDRNMGGLDVYDSTGNFLYGLPVSVEYVFDRDDRYIGVFYDGVFRLYQDEKEVALIETDMHSLKDMALNVEENLLVLMGLKNLEVYELVSQKLIWDFRLFDPNHWYSSLDLSPDGRHIVCGVDINLGNSVPKDKRHVKGYLMIFPRNGKTMEQHNETYDLWGLGLPKGVFSTTGGSLITQTREKIAKTRLR